MSLGASGTIRERKTLAACPQEGDRSPVAFFAPLPYNYGVRQEKIIKILEGKDRRKSVHFIGIGGIGLSSLARWFLAQGWTVTGSDLVFSEITGELEKEGVKIKIGAKTGISGRPHLIIRSQAIMPENPEFKAAAKTGAPILSYPEMIGVLTRRYRTIAVAGAHGKSTTTSLLGLVAVKAKLDPTVIVGTKLKEFRVSGREDSAPQGSNFRSGRSEWLVLEADEFGRAFLNYSPAHLIVTNIDREHLDIYKGLADIKRTFLELMERVIPGGYLVMNADSVNLAMIKPQVERVARKRGLHLLWYSVNAPVAKKIKAALQIPGDHNLSNAVGAYTLARKALGIPEATILSALGAFTGSWRRYDYQGTYREGSVSYKIFDDYGHHPTEVLATLKAFKEKFPRSVLIVAFQPHQAERLKRLFKEFKTCFEPADVALLFPEYRVAGRDELPTPFTSRALALAVKKRSPKQIVEYIEDPEYFSREIIRAARQKTGLASREAVVVMMGAGSVVKYTKRLFRSNEALK